MKVFEIIERDNDGATAGNDPVTGMELPTTGNAGLDATLGGAAAVGLNRGTAAVSNRVNANPPTPEVRNIPKDFLVSDIEDLGEGRMKANVLIEKADGTLEIVEFQGKPGEIGNVLGEKLPAAKAGRFRRLFGKAGRWVVRKTSWILSNSFFGTLGAGISILQGIALWNEYRDNIAMLRIIMEEGYHDTPASRAIAIRSHNYITYAFYTAVGVEVAGTVASALTASKVLRLARALRAGTLFIPGAGWVVALVTTAIMEGGIYLVSWFINKYGPRWFAETFIDEWSIGNNTPQLEPINVGDDPGMQDAMRQDVENPNSNFDQSSIDRISQNIQNAAGSPRVTVRDAQNAASGDSSGSNQSAADRINALRNR